LNPVLRAAILTSSLLPYLYFGIRDVMHHRQHRRVSLTEWMLHITLSVTLAIVIPHAYLGHFDVVVPGLMLFVTARAMDEFVFHHGLAASETDFHAKTHFGFLIFVVGIMGANVSQPQVCP
jgi:hypothetical protein